jgi:hypothetical protein
MKNSKLGRLLIASGLALLLMLFAWEAFSEELHIIEVRRNIPLADRDPIYRDYYINAGPEAGLKPNMVVTAVRKLNIKDATGAHSFGELLVPVGQLKIIYAQNHIAVAREYKLLSREDLPMLEQTGVMTGDQIDLKGSFIDNRRSSAKTSRREETTPENAEKAEVKVEVKTEAKSEGETAKTAEAPAETADPQKAVLESMAAAMDRVSNKTE